jgi:hypothetical protein
MAVHPLLSVIRRRQIATLRPSGAKSAATGGKVESAVGGDGVPVYRFACPHCQGFMEVEHKQINCQIFRHGWFKSNGQQIPPHHPKAECDTLVQNGLINGCGKPFKFDGTNVVICDYI